MDGMVRAYLTRTLRIGAKDTMDYSVIGAPEPFVYLRAVAIFEFLRIKHVDTRRLLMKEITEFFYKIGVNPLDRYNISTLSRSIGFLSTKTGQFCFHCLTFDLSNSDDAHMARCRQNKKKIGTIPDHFGIDANEFGELVCPACFMTFDATKNKRGQIFFGHM